MPFPPVGPFVAWAPKHEELDITELQPEGGMPSEIGESRERCKYCGNFTNRDRYGIPQCCDDAQWDAMED